MPQDFEDARRRRSSCRRSCVRATSMPPLWVKTPSSRYWRTLSSVNWVISLLWSVRKMKFEAWPVEPPGLGSGPLSMQQDVAPTEPRKVVGHAVADDARADDDDPRVRRYPCHESLALPLAGGVRSRHPTSVPFAGATVTITEPAGARSVVGQAAARG